MIRDIKIHAAEKPFICEVCFKKFSYERNPNNHNSTHTWEPFICKACFKEFPDERNLNNISTHTWKSFMCEVFSYKTSLKEHLHTHAREK